MRRTRKTARPERGGFPSRAKRSSGHAAPVLGDSNQMLQAKLAVGPVDDPLEREADRVADAVTSDHAVPAMAAAPGGVQRKEATAGAPAAGSALLGSSGSPLDAASRAYFEPRFGRDLGDVRIHSDSQAAASADAMGARAFTMGKDIAFAAGELRPDTREGRHLVAHELAHVVQQERAQKSAPRIQRKLVASGDTAGFATFANSVIAVQFRVVVADTGEVSLESTNVQGPPTQEAAELVTALRTSINDTHLINMEFIHGQTSTRASDANVLGGNFALARVDLDDLSAMGTRSTVSEGGRTGGSILVHEVTEQYRRQVLSEDFTTAHGNATKAEEAAIGATRGTERYRQVDAATLEVTIPYTYPDGHIVEVTWDIVNGNYGNVRRKTLPRP